MGINVKEIKIAYVIDKLPNNIIKHLLDLEAVMVYNYGGGQYSIEEIKNTFDEDSD